MNLKYIFFGFVGICVLYFIFWKRRENDKVGTLEDYRKKTNDVLTNLKNGLQYYATPVISEYGALPLTGMIIRDTNPPEQNLWQIRDTQKYLS